MNETQKPALLKQNDIVSFYHIQMPHWLFADTRYNHISLSAKVAYSLLLNRYQLSKLHNWINEDGEVYIIYTREELAKMIQVGANKAISIFKELIDAGLVWEKRRGNNKANHIFLTRVVLSDEDAVCYDNAPFISEFANGTNSGSLEITHPSTGVDGGHPTADEDAYSNEASGHVKIKGSDTSESNVMTSDNQIPGALKSKHLDMEFSNPSYINSSKKDISNIDLSQSVSQEHATNKPDIPTDGEISELDEILERCELWAFGPETAKVFESAIERLFFSENYKIGNCVLPKQKVRSHLHELDQINLQVARDKMHSNTDTHIRNTTAYTMAVIFNSICESESDIMLDPYLNSLRVHAQVDSSCNGGQVP